MTKFKKIVSGTLAGCLMASALMMSAGAANVQTTVISKAGVQAAAQTYRIRLHLTVAWHRRLWRCRCIAASACAI